MIKSILQCFVLLWCTTLLYSCASDEKPKYVAPTDAMFVQLPASETGVNFANNVEDDSSYNILTYRNFYNGGGVATGDINNDGLPDIFLTANLGESKLYLNKGNFKFEDITPKSGIKSKKGWRTGVTMADVNADGWLDIYICNSGDIKGDDKENELYINQHDNTFKEQAKELGLNDSGYTTHIAFFDYDLDGDLDAYILNNSFVDVYKFDLDSAKNIRDPMGGHKLMRNDNGHFSDVSATSGIASIKIAYGLGVSVSDVNGDMYPDIYVSNDFYEKDYLYINQRDGTFKDQLPERTGHISSSSMGADIADINNDGYMDVITTDMLPEDEKRLKTMNRFEEYHVESMKYRSSFHYQYPQNCLQLNDGNGVFSEVGWYAGVSATDWSWGALVFDFDNDGHKDIFISNGVYRDITDMDFADFIANKAEIRKVVEEKGKFDFRDFLPYMNSTRLANYAYVSQPDMTFKNESAELGLGQPSFSNGVAYADLDNDGDFDLVVNNLNDPCFVYRNDANKKASNHYLKVNCKGEGLNPFGVGAWLNLYTKGQKLVLQNYPVRSFQSCMDTKLIFGLGKNSTVDSLEVIWPNLSRQVIYNVPVDKEITVSQKDADKKFILPSPKQAMFVDASQSLLKSPVKHTENRYVDFDGERLIPYMLSTQGPKLAEGDVNRDGFVDLYLGGSVENPGKLLLGGTSGFTISNQPVFEQNKEREDAGASFIDIDNDGDLDLVVASGGYQFDQGSSLVAARLYLNDGKGNFSEGSMPSEVATNASCVSVADYDKDGFTDVFIGCRAIAGNYGKPGRSYLLHNEKGVLKDQTPDALKEPGMVTAAVWNDNNKDGYPELVLVGDWMAITFFANNKGKLEAGSPVPNSSGWWNCISAADIDKDGDMDFVVGNFGLNSRLKVSAEKPMELFINDFDNNGMTESVLAYYWPDGKSHLFNSKQDATIRMPILKKRFLQYKDFAGKSVAEVLGDEMISKAQKLQAQTLASSVLVNEGNGNYKLVPLTGMAQLSPMFSIVLDDLDHDGNIDMFAGGNFYDVKPDLGRMDAKAIYYLKGDGKGGFEYAADANNSIEIKGQVRDLALVNANGKKVLVLARNNDSVIMLEAK